MKSRPILFSGPMVRAILDGSKTQTRRIVKNPYCQATKFQTFDDDGNAWFISGFDGHSFKCPYGRPGDTLWVKENFHIGAYVDQDHAKGAVMSYAESKSTVFCHMTADEMKRCRLKADPRPWAESRTIPCLLMPKWAYRILLEITAIRVERLQDISESDAEAEQDRSEFLEWAKSVAPPGSTIETARESYRRLWESINGAGSWDANPWVWVVEFNRVES